MDYREYLEHHGILGQRWGIRRYQNRDGSLTAAGRKRYGDKPPTTENNLTKEYLVRNASASAVYANKSMLTDDELRQAINRIRLDQDIANLAKADKVDGYAIIKSVTDKVNTVTSAFNTAGKAMSVVSGILSLTGHDESAEKWKTRGTAFSGQMPPKDGQKQSASTSQSSTSSANESGSNSSASNSKSASTSSSPSRQTGRYVSNGSPVLTSYKGKRIRN